MTGYGPNTERAGGTRFSDGKPVLTWLPWRGLFYAWNCQEVVMGGKVKEPRTLAHVAFTAESLLRRAMNDPDSRRYELGGALYWLLQLCHARETGAVIEDETALASTKPPALIPVTFPALGMWEVARVSCYGAEKYAPFDWDSGQSYTTLLSSAMRHVAKMMAFGALSVDQNHGDEPEDTEYSGLLHAAHAAWNLLCLLDFEDQGRGDDMDDVTPWHGVTTARRREALARAEEEGVDVLHVLRREEFEASDAPPFLVTEDQADGFHD